MIHRRDNTDFVVAGVGLLVVVAALLYIVAGISCWMASGHWVPGRWTDSVGVVLRPGEPAAAFQHRSGVPGAVAFWSTAVVVHTSLIAATVYVHRRILRLRARPRQVARRLAATRGLSRAAEIEQAVGRRSVVRRGQSARPVLVRPSAAEVGFRLGRSRGLECWASVEDSRIAVGPPRSGKGIHQVIAAIIDAPGAVVTTSTRPDNFVATFAVRRKHGPVAVFDPQRLGRRSGLRWSPIRGCEQPSTAMTRARGLAAGAGFGKGGVEGGGFWQGQTEMVIRGLLHAAALDGADVGRLYQWGLEPASADEAVGILNRSADAAGGWGDTLEGIVRMDSRTRDSIWAGVRASFSALADPAVRDALTPTPGDGLDPKAFLEASGTIYVLGTGVGAGASSAFIAALLEDITETARVLAAGSPGGRMEPPLALVLDEIANLCAVPSLPSLMADGGGSGISTFVIIQSLAQAREQWGEQAAAAMWDAATLRLVLGGSAQPRDLQDLSTVCGERDEEIRNWSRGGDGGRTETVSTRRVPILPPSAIRTLPFGTGVLLARTAPPILLEMEPWHKRKDAELIRAGIDEMEKAS